MNKLLPSGPLMEQPIPGRGRPGKDVGMAVGLASLPARGSEILSVEV